MENQTHKCSTVVFSCDLSHHTHTQGWLKTQLVCCFSLSWFLTWRLRDRRRLLSKWPRLESSLPSRSPSTALPPMVPYSTHLPSVANELTFCSQLGPPMQSRMTSAPLPVKLHLLVTQLNRARLQSAALNLTLTSEGLSRSLVFFVLALLSDIIHGLLKKTIKIY